jgi:hypothetical protein
MTCTCIPQVKRRLSGRAATDDDIVEMVNREVALVLLETRQRLNEFLGALCAGNLCFGGVNLLVGTGVPTVDVPLGSLWIRTDPGPGETVWYIRSLKESGPYWADVTTV